MSDNSGALLRAKMYGEDDLSSNEVFSGNFINFGYWRNFKRGKHLGIDERTQSQANLYRVVLDSLNIAPTNVALEVGCGIGVGAVLALREYEPSSIHGLDLSRDQLDRAMRVTGELARKWRNRLIFCQGSALALPYADEKFDKCYSVEAAQHFDDLPKFAAEAYRVVKSSGRLSVTTFFMPPTAAFEKLRRLLQNVDNGIDVVVSIDSFRNDLLKAGFDNVRVESLGMQVWEGYDSWIENTKYKDSCARNWLKVYNQGLLDYYLVTADKR